MKTVGSIASAAMFGVVLVSVLVPTSAATHYGVFCANDRIEVDMRSLEEMRSARGSGVCLFGSFDYLSDAQQFAKRNFGGEGAPCRCR